MQQRLSRGARRPAVHTIPQKRKEIGYHFVVMPEPAVHTIPQKLLISIVSESGDTRLLSTLSPKNLLELYNAFTESDGLLSTLSPKNWQAGKQTMAQTNAPAVHTIPQKPQRWIRSP